MNFQDRYNRLQQEIRDLKTAQTIPGLVALYSAMLTIQPGTYEGTYTWTINYKDVNDPNPPITYMHSGTGDSLLLYNPITNTQKFEMHRISETIYVATTMRINSSRPIESITPDF